MLFDAIYQAYTQDLLLSHARKIGGPEGGRLLSNQGGGGGGGGGALVWLS